MYTQYKNTVSLNKILKIKDPIDIKANGIERKKLWIIGFD